MKENEKPIPYGLRLASIQWPKDLKEEGETNSLGIKTYFQYGKRNIKVNKKPFSFGFRLDSIQRQKEFKEERETNSLRIKTCFQLMAKRT